MSVNPHIFVRKHTDNIQRHDETLHVCSAESSIDGTDSVKVDMFCSLDTQGFVLRITNGWEWDKPYVRQIEDGCEIHIGGKHEAINTLEALKGALGNYKPFPR